MSCKLNPHIERYLFMVENEEIRTCEEQKLLAKLIRHCFETEDIYVNDEQLEKYLSLSAYFPFEKIFEWQKFILALHDCTFRRDGMPRWSKLFCLIGRGAGKDGMIAYESLCLMSPYHDIKGYDIDICANNEEQAMRPVKDVLEVLETPANTKKLKKFFYWNKEEIKSLKTKSVMKGRTNNPKGKDGLRSGIVIFNEIHQYENYDNINVFVTGLGKKKHPRRSYYTTNGDVRGGPLDDLMEKSLSILRGKEPDRGLLPFICKLDDKSEADDPKNWEKANPSLPYLPALQEEIHDEYEEWKKNPEQLPAFMTKRMNIADENREIAVATWESIAASNEELPDLTGWNCVVGIDYAKVTDFVSVDFHFQDGDKRYDINHSWLCLRSADLARIKAPWKEWAKQGKLTLVDDVEIHPELITQYIYDMGEKYNILKIAMDNFRYTLLTGALYQIGFDAKDRKNIKLIRPSDIMKLVPVMDSCFANKSFVWGDNPVLRWATNNTKKARPGVKTGVDTGNYIYAKIEGRSRKTDPFMALVAAMTIEDELEGGGAAVNYDIGAFTF